MKNLFAIVLAIAFSLTSLISQQYKIEDLYDFDLVNMGEIDNGGTITGYYLFFKTDKKDKKTQNYKLVFLDTDLQEIKSVDKSGNKDIRVVDAVYNGNALMLKYFDQKKNELFYEIYNNSAELIYSKGIEIYRSEIDTYISGERYQSLMPTGLSSASDMGFVDIGFKKKNGYRYEIRYFGNNSLDESWIYLSDNEGGFETAGYLATNENYISLMVFRREKIMDTKYNQGVLNLSVKEGKVVSEYKKADIENSVFTSGYVDENGNVDLIGLNYLEKHNIVLDPSIGLVHYTFDKDGALTSHNSVGWGKLIPGSLTAKGNGKKKRKKSKRKKGNSKKKKSKNRLFFHQFVMYPDGRIFAIAEEFRKRADGVGIALAALGGSASLVEIRIENLVIAEITKDFKIGKIKKLRKKASSFKLPPGSLYLASALLGFQVQNGGGFDYLYTQEITGDDGFFYTAYYDRGMGKGRNGSEAFKFTAYLDGEFVNDKIVVNQDASDVVVYKAKPGHVLIAEYFKKSKDLELRLEPLNF